MGLSEFINKFRSRYLWCNLLAMAVVVIVLLLSLKIGLNIYTHHGQAIEIPDVRKMSMDEAVRVLEDAQLTVEVGDTGYVKELPADCILEQSPAAGQKVKAGHRISLVVNASDTPTLSLPDLAGNCSQREAVAKLKAMGFKVGMPMYVEGEKDWVYGITVDGKECYAGERIPVNKTIVVQVGNGMLAAEDSIHYVDGNGEADDFGDVSGDIDDFVEIP